MKNKLIIMVFVLFLIFPLCNINIVSAKPTSKPKIIGPSIGPPSRAQINNWKYTLDPEFKNKKKEDTKKSFFEWLWSLITNIF